jgi:hypothetical protein
MAQAYVVPIDGETEFMIASAPGARYFNMMGADENHLFTCYAEPTQDTARAALRAYRAGLEAAATPKIRPLVWTPVTNSATGHQARSPLDWYWVRQYGVGWWWESETMPLHGHYATREMAQAAAEAHHRKVVLSLLDTQDPDTDAS